MSSVSVVKSTCRIVRLVPDYQAAALSCQLTLKLAEILDAKLSKEVMISSSCSDVLLVEQQLTVSLLCLLVGR